MCSTKRFGYAPDARTRVSSRTSWIVRFWPALACLLLPPIFYFGIFKTVVRPLVRYEFAHIPGDASGQTTSLAPATSMQPLTITHALLSSDYFPPDGSASADSMKLTAKALDLSGRLDFTIPSALLLFIAIIAAILSFIVISRRAQFPLNVCLYLLGALPGLLLVYGLRHEEGTREIIVRPIIDELVKESLLSESVRSLALGIIQWNVGAGIFSTIVVVVALSVLSVQAAADELVAPVLRRRLYDFKALMIVVAVVLVLTVVITRTLIQWQLDFLSSDGRKALLPLATSLANYWGASSTGVMLAAFLPPFFSWTRDVSAFSEISLPEGTQSERQEYLAKQGLVFAPVASVTAILTVAAPALATPVLDAVSHLLQAQSG